MVLVLKKKEQFSCLKIALGVFREAGQGMAGRDAQILCSLVASKSMCAKALTHVSISASFTGKGRLPFVGR